MSDNMTYTELYRTDVPNSNGDIYPKATVLAALEEYSKDVANYTALGYIAGSDWSSQEYLQISKASHLVEKVEDHPDGFIITSRILNTVAGDVLKDMINDKFPISYGIRCIGDVHNNVISIKKLISFDILPLACDEQKVSV